MRVKCKWKRGDEVPSTYTFEGNPHISKEWRLTAGKEYVVYAVECYEGKTWYCVIDDANLWFPMMKPAPLFEITDPRPSALWRVAFKYGRDWKTKENSIEILLVAFEEWCTDPLYYERLADKSAREVEIFSKRKKEMDSE
jgi:hypothetical protein